MEFFSEIDEEEEKEESGQSDSKNETDTETEYDYLESGYSEHLDKKELIPVRVGFILYNTFNGRLLFIDDGDTGDIIITVATDNIVDTLPSDVIMNVQTLLKRLTGSTRGRYKAPEFKLSSTLKSSLNQVFIITRLMPHQSLNRYVGLMHPQLCFIAAINALLTCFIGWPMKLARQDRIELCQLLYPALDSDKIVNKLLLSSETGLIKSIQYINEIVMGEKIKSIKRKCSELTIAEQSYLCRTANVSDYDDYIEFMESKTEGLIESKLTDLVKPLVDCVKSLEDLTNSKEERKRKINENLTEITNWQSHRRDLQSVELSVLLTIKSQLENYFHQYFNIFSEPVKKEFDRFLIMYEKEKKADIGVSQAAIVDTILPDFIKNRMDDKEYDAAHRFILNGSKLLGRAISAYLGKFEYEEEKKIELIISEFFKQKQLSRRVTLSGGIKGNKGLNTLMAYVFTIITFVNSDSSISDDDRLALENVREKLVSLSQGRATLPVQAIVKSVEKDFNKLVMTLPESARTEYKSLCSQLQMSANYSQAWSIALRLKGLVYEAYFAEDWNVEYLPEDLKLNLMSIVRHTVPGLASHFMKRTMYHTEVREFKADFCLVKSPPLTKNLTGIVDGIVPVSIPLVEELNKSEEKSVFSEISLQGAVDDSLVSSEVSKASSLASSVQVSRGKSKPWHELGSDEIIKTSDPRFFPTVQKLINYGAAHDAKGGIITEDFILASDQNTDEAEEEVARQEQTRKETKDIMEEVEEFGFQLHDDEKAKEDKEMKLCRNWNDIEYLEDSNRYEIVLIEVGYQTDQEGKIVSDLAKWNTALNILKSLNLKVSVISAVDRTNQPTNQWWIKEQHVLDIKHTLGRLFAGLSTNSPLDISEHIIGDISSQKLRMSLRTGSLVRPPVTNSDVQKYFVKWRNTLMKRPTGCRIPERIESDFIQSAVLGATVPSDYEYVTEQLSEISDNANKIIQCVKKGQQKIIKLWEVRPSELLILGWLKSDIKHSYCDTCINQLEQKEKTYARLDFISLLCNRMNFWDPCLECRKLFPQKNDRSCYMKDFLTMKTNCMTSKYDNINIHPDNASKFNNKTKSENYFDRLVKILIPSKTQKHRRIKQLKKRICDYMMRLNNLPAYKDSKGQLFISQNFKRIQRNLEVSDPTDKRTGARTLNTISEEELLTIATEDTYDKGLSKFQITHIRAIKDDCKQILSLMGSEFSPAHKEIFELLMENPILSDTPRSVFKASWIGEALKALRIEEDSKQFVSKIVSRISEYAKERVKDDTLPIITYEEVSHYLLSKETEIDWMSSEDQNFNWSCVFFENVIGECKRRLDSTVYEKTLPFIIRSVELLLNFNWFQRCVLYSKICQTFIVCCSEFQHSGLKTKKIPHTNFNLVIKVPEDKSANMLCSIKGKNFEDVNNDSFFLNRRSAILGQSLPYCYITCFIQICQMFNCVTALSLSFDLLKVFYEEEITKFKALARRSILGAKKGSFYEFSEEIIQFSQNRFNAEENKISSVLINVLCGFNLSFSTLIGPSIALNSQLFNKQLQTIRYPYMLSLSEFGFPEGVGNKMSGPRRRIETEISRLWLMLSSFSSNMNTEKNIKAWKSLQIYPNISLLSISIFGSTIISDRHFVYDIYLVHIYNKELDNFAQGQIRVLDEYAERHKSWEDSVSDAVKASNSKNRKEKKKGYQQLRLLLGIPNIDTKHKGINNIKRIKENLKPALTRDYNLIKLTSTEISDDGSLSSSSSGTSQPSLSTVKSRDSASMAEFYTRSVGSYSMKLGENLEIIRSKETENQEIIRPIVNSVEYRPVIRSVMKDVEEILTTNPKHTYGSYELVQIFTEFGKTVYNRGALEKARRSKRNWTSITNVVETTSIISEPLRYISLTQSMSIIKRELSKKLMKLLKQRIDHSSDAKGTSEKKIILEYFEEQMSELGTDMKDLGKKVTQCVSDSNKLSYMSWKILLKMNLHETLLSNDANKTYYWIKSLSKDIANEKNKPGSTGLLFKSPIFKLLRDKLRSINQKDNLLADISHDELQKSYEIWLTATKHMFTKLKVPMPDASDMILMIKDMQELFSNYKTLKINKKKFETTSFFEDEAVLNRLENRFVEKYSAQIAIIFNLLVIHILCSPWTQLLTAEDFGILHLEQVIQSNTEIDDQNIQVKASDIIVTLLQYERGFEDYLHCSVGDTTMILKYVIALFSCNDLPFKHIYDSPDRNFGIINSYSRLLREVRQATAILTLKELGVDFYLTVITIRSKNFMYTKRLLGKGGNDRLPRSTRSKVLYELVKKIYETKHAILQQQAFTMVMDVEHRNFATLAPKAQLGGDRDLLVQETNTKLINAVSELFAKSCLDNTVTDALVNPKVKEIALESMNEQKKLSANRHGTPVKSVTGGDDDLVNFYYVVTSASDHQKWGPIHCCTFFSGMDQQLLKESQDWCNFMMLVNLKNLNKQIEIPISSIEKLLKSFLYSDYYKEYIQRPDISKSDNEKRMSNALSSFSDVWSWKPYIPFLIKHYISKGWISMNSWNHMGQGIHHAKSSLFGDIMRIAMKEVVVRWFNEQIPHLLLEISSAGSSDDMTLLFKVTGSIKKSIFEETMVKVRNVLADCFQLWIGLSRSCQMSLSEKSVFSTCVNEMYSDFDLFYRISPSVIKFTISTIINSTITTPLTLYQSMHVASQQALYMSCPFLTNLVFCLCRQQVIFNHNEEFLRENGEIVFRLPSSFGRIYIPKMSTLLTNSLEVEDLIECVESLKIMDNYLKFSKLISVPKGIFGIIKSSEPVTFKEKVNEFLERMSTEVDANINPHEDDMNTSQETAYMKPGSVIMSHGSEVEYNEASSESVGAAVITGRYHNEDSDPPISDSASSSNAGLTSLQKQLKEELKESNNQTEAFFDLFSTQHIKNTNLDHYHPDSRNMITDLTMLYSQEISFNHIAYLASSKSGISTSNLVINIAAANLTCIILSYYKYLKTTGIEKPLKGESMYKITGAFEDPFMYTLPDNVKQHLQKLKLLKSEIAAAKEENMMLDEPLNFIAKSLIESNCATEDYLSESNRIRQIVNSRNIINSLSGGMKEHSLPIYRMIMRSYFFFNKVPVKFLDHWNTVRDASQRTTEHNLVRGENKVRYQDWIKQMLKFIPIKSDEDLYDHISQFEIMINPSFCEPIDESELSSKSSAVVDSEKRFMVYDHERTKEVKDLIINLIPRLSSYNRIKMSKAESSTIHDTYSSKGAVVAKTRLFSREATFKLDNNPAVVMAHIIDPIGASSCRPVGVNYATLENDKTALVSFHPLLNDINLTLKQKQLKDPTEIKAIISTVSSLCRSISLSSLSSTPFYAFRPNKVKYDDSVTSILGHSIVEGLEFKIEEIEAYSSTYSEKYFRIMECLSLIGALPIDDSKKTKLLMCFLLWNPYRCSENILHQDQKKQCEDRIGEKEIIKLFDNETIATQLFMEAKAIKSESERAHIINLANLAMNPEQIGLSSKKTDLSLTFKALGREYEDGRFQMSCEYGSAVGIFSDGKLIISLSKKSMELLNAVELEVLKWCFSIRTHVASQHQHSEFLQILASYNQSKKLVSKSEPVGLKLRRGQGEYGIQMGAPERDSKVVYIKAGLLTERSFVPEQANRSPEIKWYKNSISIYLTNETIEINESSFIKSVINILKEMNHHTTLTDSTKALKEQRFLIDKIDFPEFASKPSCQIMHLFFWHLPENPSILPVSRRTKLENIKRDGYSDYYLQLVKDDKSVDLINKYALKKSPEEKESLERLKKLFIEGVRFVEDKRVGNYGQDSSGIYSLDDEENKVYYVKGTEEYNDIKRVIDNGSHKRDKNYLDIPEGLPDSLAREITNLMDNKGKSAKLLELQSVINKEFKDINAWPHINILLDELDYNKIKLVAKDSPIDHSLQWRLTEIADVQKIKASRNLFDCICQFKSGHVPVSFSYMIITNPSLEDYFKQLESLNTYISSLPFTRNQILLCIALIIYLEDFRVEKGQMSFDWIDMLSTTLPITVKSKKNLGEFTIKIIMGVIVSQFSIEVTSDQMIIIDKKVDAACEKYESNRNRSLAEFTRKRRGKPVPQKLQVPFDKKTNRLKEIGQFITTQMFPTGCSYIKELYQESNVTPAKGSHYYTFMLNDKSIKKSIGIKKLFSNLSLIPDIKIDHIFGLCYSILQRLFGHTLTRNNLDDIGRMIDFVESSRRPRLKRLNVENLITKKEQEDTKRIFSEGNFEIDEWDEGEIDNFSTDESYKESVISSIHEEEDDIDDIYELSVSMMEDEVDIRLPDEEN